jgi:hypothetical protein
VGVVISFGLSACGGEASSASRGGLGSTGGAGGTGGAGTAGTSANGGSSAGGSGGITKPFCGPGSPRVPQNHRANAETCTPVLVADAGCPVGCPADDCHVDGDCASGTTCACSGTSRGYSARDLGNVCLPSNCRVDSDCSTGYCSPTVSASCGKFYGTEGFYCHTCDDTCADDADCVDSTGQGYCAYDVTVGHWACGHSFCAG